MSVKTILKMGDPRLLRVAQPVLQFDTDELHLLITDLLDTMRSADGAGLAAPQIGVDLQLVIFGSNTLNPRYPDAPVVPRTVLINPTITPLPTGADSVVNPEPSNQQVMASASEPQLVEDWEGCLSVPGLRAKVPRFECIRYTGFDQFGDPIDRTVSGFHARVVQHECDHLMGVLYPMRVRDFQYFGYTEVLFPGLGASDD
jgi:peptide deformylase